jgi:hypothetical protein
MWLRKVICARSSFRDKERLKVLEPARPNQFWVRFRDFDQRFHALPATRAPPKRTGAGDSAADNRQTPIRLDPHHVSKGVAAEAREPAACVTTTLIVGCDGGNAVCGGSQSDGAVSGTCRYYCASGLWPPWESLTLATPAAPESSREIARARHRRRQQEGAGVNFRVVDLS